MQNNSYIHNLKMEDVPWHRLPTTYGRAKILSSWF